MRAKILMSVLVLLISGCSAFAAAADQKEEPVAIVYKSGETVNLQSLEVGYDDKGLFGSSWEKLKKLPIKADKLKLDVPLENLAKIEFLSVDAEGKNVKLRLTALDGKTLEGTLDHEKKLVWKGKHPFADSEATLDLAEVKEIILKKQK